MDDLISRQAAIDILAIGDALLSRALDDMDVVGVERDKFEWGLGLIESYIEDFKELPSVNQWIPCSERLPEDDDYRPCYGHDDGAVWWINDIGQMGLGWYYTSTKTWAYYDEISSSEKSVGNVVAWMPLPPSFKEE